MSTPLSRALSHRLHVSVFLGLSLVAATLCGCRDFSNVTASLAGADSAMPNDDSSLHAYADRWGKIYDGAPGEKIASMNYARALRALTRYDEAASVMRTAAVKAPKDYEVLGAYGKALGDAGQLEQARDVLTRAYPPDRPDWTIMSVQGSVADRLNDHQTAQRFYRDALKIAPAEPNVLSNLGLSYALTKQLDLAEESLREAAASPRADARVRQNLALVLALDGKFAEAEQVSRRDMSAEDAARNVHSIREMIAQNDSWKTLQSGRGRSPSHGESTAPTPLASAPG